MHYTNSVPIYSISTFPGSGCRDDTDGLGSVGFARNFSIDKKPRTCNARLLT